MYNRRSTKKLTEEDIRSRVISKLKELKLDHVSFVEITEFKGSSSRIKLYCSIHQVYWTMDYHAFVSRKIFGCRRCAASHSRDGIRLSREDFIKRAREIHGDKYDYSLVGELKNMNELVTIICPKHGPFQQTPSSHVISGHGCRKCVYEKDIETKISRGEESFLKRAREKYGDRFDYSKVEYRGGGVKVRIICPEHGEFLITPNRHLSSPCGCPICSSQHHYQSCKLSDDIWRERVEKKLEELRTWGFDIVFVKFLSPENEVIGHSKIRLHCNIHNITWDSELAGFVYTEGVYCPECSRNIQRSLGEKTSVY